MPTNEPNDPAGDYSPVCDGCGEYVDGGGCSCPYCERCGEVVSTKTQLTNGMCFECQVDLCNKTE